MFLTGKTKRVLIFLLLRRHIQHLGGPISTLKSSQDDTITARAGLMDGSPLLPIMVAMLFIFGLLLTFHYVVSDGKLQAELRHKATALRAAALWHCNSAPGIAARNRCLSQISSPDSSSNQL